MFLILEEKLYKLLTIEYGVSYEYFIQQWKIIHLKMDEGQKGNRRLYESTRSNRYIYIYMTYIYVNPTTGYRFLTSENGIFCRICHMLDHKMSLRNFLKFETIQSFFSSYDGMKLVINNRNKN